jgi:hypothetical protein
MTTGVPLARPCKNANRLEASAADPYVSYVIVAVTARLDGFSVSTLIPLLIQELGRIFATPFVTI